MPRLELVIFDLDGVITDTAELHFQAWKRLAESLGVEIDHAFNEQLKGIGRMQSLEKILELGGMEKEYTEEEKVALAADKNVHYRALLESLSPNDILTGILPLLDRVKENQIPIALGSASKNATYVLDELRLTDRFDYIVDANQVKHGKPDPETFTTAADYFKVPYEHCLGIEDAPAGVEAVNAAGMFSVGVGSKEDLSHANYRVDHTGELDFEKIIQAYENK
ncbi:beta-phosphoglucomutase [Halalkalibacillus halophilus]|uniref:beta-phosphoglucomutase n=1 Tax=Halalkalibacillus halophilus TaxID=392827 RepID=UPI000418A607|nr:beta-phosphoglucomutase [Halalkalibacillus halophilus]